MAVYVDELRLYHVVNSQAKRYGQQWCHMICNGDLEELHQMAEKIGLKRSYFQDHPRFPHYDLTPTKRKHAILAGAVPIKSEEFAHMIAEKIRQERWQCSKNF